MPEVRYTGTPGTGGSRNMKSPMAEKRKVVETSVCAGWCDRTLKTRLEFGLGVS
jgi:hypothetical protein